MSAPHHALDHSHEHDHDDEHDLGLQHDLQTLQRKRLGRRGMLGIFGGIGAVGALAACGADASSSSAATGSATTGGSGDRPSGGPPAGGFGGEVADVEVADGEIPEETNGPYPADGTNGVNVLTEEGIVRSDITTSFGSASGVAEGVPLTVRFKVYDLQGSEAVLMPGASLYAWHCDRAGLYSMYSQEIESENYLRGVQEADDEGWLEFTTIFPGCYAGRWPHIHFEVYETLDAATSATNRLRTSQLAFPQEVCETVYAEAGYEDSVANLAQLGTIDGDSIFSDGYSLQMATITGSVAAGYVATLTVPV